MTGGVCCQERQSLFLILKKQVVSVKTSEKSLEGALGSLGTNLYAFEIPALRVGVVFPANVDVSDVMCN